MSNVRTVFSMLRSIGSVVFALFTASLVLLAILSFAFRSTIADKENYVTAVRTSAFSERMTNYLREELESECLFYDLPFSVLDDALASVRVDVFAGEYAGNVYEALLHGSNLEIPAWSAQPFIDAVQRFFDALPAEEKPFDASAAVTVGTELSDYALSVLRGGIQEGFLRKGYQLLSHPIMAVLHRTGMIVGATLACMVLVLLCGWQRRKKSIYVLCFAESISAFVAPTSFWLLNRYGLMERIALADSPLKLYIESFYNSFLQEALFTTVFCFLVTVVLFLLSILLNCMPSREK